MKAVRLGCTTALLASAILAATAAPLWAKSPKLPVTAPVPDMNRVEAPDEAAPGQPPQSGDVPVPEKRPPGPNDAKPTPTGRIFVDFLNRKFPAYMDTGLNLVDVAEVARTHVSALTTGNPGRRPPASPHCSASCVTIGRIG